MPQQTDACTYARTEARTHVCTPPAELTAEQGEAGLEAVAGALQPKLVIHLHVDVLQRRQRRDVRVAVVPAHQGQTPQEQALVYLGAEARLWQEGALLAPVHSCHSHTSSPTWGNT